MISPEIQKSLKRQNRYNIIHLEAGEGLDWSKQAEGQYSGTADLFNSWMRDGVLRQDTQPSYYLLRHDFSLGGVTRSRLGLIAGVGLEDYQTRQVLPHEFTEAPAIRDRVSLMESLGANISPIMGLYRDAAHGLEPVFRKAMANQPEIDANDEFGSVTTLWRIAGPDDQAEIQRFFQERPIYLADGHHRYEAARHYQLARHSEDPASVSPRLAHNYVMMTLIAFDDPGLVVLPYHRSLNGLPEDKLTRILGRLNGIFESKLLNATTADEMVQEVERLGRDGRVMASVGPGNTGGRLLTLKESAVGPDWGPLAVSEGWVLEEKVLRPELGDSTLEHLGFLHDHYEAVERVASGQLQMAFLMKPFPLEAFEHIVGDGHRLPRKSTFFYPKLPTGLVINRLAGDL
jgi:uncharacterized protein (DUF1015 family)